VQAGTGRLDLPGRSAPTRTGIESVRRPSAAGRAAGGVLPALGTFSAGQVRGAILSADPALGAARAYLHDVGRTTLLADGAKATAAISSLVPSTQSRYAHYLALGEKAFQLGDFADAFNYFEMASYIVPRAPETLLSLAQARFAMSSLSYTSTAHYLRQTLKCFPELPMVPLDPRAFYGQDSAAVARYVQRLDGLERYLVKAHDDMDALLVLAYFRWFSGRGDDAKTALAAAITVAIEDKDEGMVDAIDTFWAGMVRTGKVSGTIRPIAPAKTGSGQVPRVATP